MKLSAILNPFDKYTDRTLQLTSVIITILGCVSAYLLGALHDGVLDLHFVNAVSIGSAIMNNLIDISTATVILFFAGLYINRRCRIGDIIYVVAISRLPIYLLGFLNAGGHILRATENLEKSLRTMNPGDIGEADMIVIIITGLLSVISLIWMVALLYNGFKVATNAKGTLHTIIFIVAVLAAEVVSKIIFYYIYQ